MRAEIEIAEKFEQLNTLAKNMKEHHAYVNITELACYTHTMATLSWVLGDTKEIPMENLMKRELERKLIVQRKERSKTK